MSAEPATTPNRLPFIDPQQMAIPLLGPEIGGRYRHRSLGTVAVVIGLAQRRYGWTTIRCDGGEQQIKTETFLRIYQPF